MKRILLPVCILAIISFTACNTIYKSGQTPDDLYTASPKVKEIINTKYEKPEDLHEDRQIRMAVYDYRWRNLDYNYDYNYSYNPYHYGFAYGYYYNPFYYPYPVYSPGITFVNPKNTAIRMANLGGYQYTPQQQTYTKTNSYTQPVRSTRYNNSNYEPRSSSSETRTYTPPPARSQSSGNSNSNSSSERSTSGGSTGRPARGN